jgi:hypothetical protein
MRKTTKWARVAIIVAAVAKLIATPWGAAMTTLVALASAIGVWFADWHHVQYWLASLATFVAILWAAAGIVWLGTRSAPQFVRLHQDYRYSLTFEGLMPHYDPNDPERALSFGIQLRNFSGGPLRYVVEDFDVRVGRRALPRVKKDHLKSVMARGAGRTSTTEPFSADDIKDLLGKRSNGTVELSITYGHPEDPPVSRLRMGFDIVLDFTNPPLLGFAAPIREESDTPI